MAKKLNANVHVQDDDGDMHVFGPDDTVPAWARKKITNKSVWEGEDDDEPASPAKTPRGAAPAPE